MSKHVMIFLKKIYGGRLCEAIIIAWDEQQTRCIILINRVRLSLESAKSKLIKLNKQLKINEIYSLTQALSKLYKDFTIFVLMTQHHADKLRSLLLHSFHIFIRVLFILH